jgi:hypothetical protein
MKQQYSNSKFEQDSSSEKGIVLPVVAASLFAILTMMAFAVDSGNLYRAGLRLQKAADAAAIAATSKLAIDGSGHVAAARAVAERNLELGGFAFNPADIQIAYNAAIRRVTVRVKARTNLILMSMIPFENPWTDWELERISQAELQSAVVSIVADHSAEMGCTWDFNCGCVGGLCSNAKIDRVRNTADFFVDLFDPNMDFVSLVRFATGANRFPAMGDMNPANPNVGGFDMNLINAVIASIGVPPSLNPDGLLPVGLSNLCDGFQRAYLDSQPLISDLAAIGIQKERAFVVLTDGFYNALRAQFASPKPALPPYRGHAEFYSTPQPAWVSHDYYLWEAEFVYNPVDPVNSAFCCEGPTELIQGPISVDFGSADPTLTFDHESVPDCSEINPIANLSPNGRFENCLNDLSFKTETRGTVWNPQGANWGEYQKLYYDCPLAWADWARENRAAVYAIGFGRSCGASPTDPYQGVGNPLSEQYCRHDVMLDRFTFSWNSDNNPDFPATYDTVAQMEEKGRIRGGYLPAERTVDTRPNLVALHAQIARRQKIKLCASQNDAQPCGL